MRLKTQSDIEIATLTPNQSEYRLKMACFCGFYHPFSSNGRSYPILGTGSF